jgi:CIC family chloride channel protein
MLEPFSRQKVRRLSQRLSKRITYWLDRYGISEPATIMITALIVGIGAGLGAVVFRHLIDWVFEISYGGIAGLLNGISPLHLLIIPALGGAIFGPLIYRFAREAKGHGVPEVMEAVALRGGRIRPQVAVIKSLASAICIGTGGSVGREGPIAQIGSAIGSTIGQLFKLSDDRIRSLVACGAAGGIAATFNAPIAGSLFALEVILGQFKATYFGAVVISAVVADVIAHIFEGDVRAFLIPEYSLVNPLELLLYVVLGAVAAVAAFGFTRLLYYSEDLWEKIRVPEYVKPIIGGLALGVIGILSPKILGFPRVFGVGYETISEALFGRLTIQLTLLLLVLKVLATITTLGSGGSGGVFAPSLFMGAMLGGAFGQISNQIFPGITAPSGAYALVGMAAFFSGAAHAPVTAVLILFEMTGDYLIILPLMLATVMSTLVSRALSSESIYTLKLTRRGVHLQYGQDIDVMQGVTVGEVMTIEVDVVTGNMSIEELVTEFDHTYHHGFPVVSEDTGELIGVVTLQDLKRALAQGDIEKKVVREIATTYGVLVAYPDEPMWEALRRMASRDVGRLPVLAKKDSNELVGVIRRRDIVKAYNHAIMKKAHHQHRFDIIRLGNLDSSKFMHVEIPAHSSIVGKQIREIELPDDCLIVSIRRGRKLRVAHGYTQINANDKLTVFAHQDCAPFVHDALSFSEDATEEPDED